MAKKKTTEMIDTVLSGDAALLKKLIEAGADPDEGDRTGRRPLHYAVQSGRIDMAKLLLEGGAMVDSQDENGNTPLSDAVFTSEGKGEVISLLLDSGADRNKKNNYDISPLELAETIDNYDVLHFFKDC